VEQLEKQQSENLERFKVRTKELKSSVSKELQEATLDAAGTFFSKMVVCLFFVLFSMRHVIPVVVYRNYFHPSALIFAFILFSCCFLHLFSFLLAIAQVCVG